MVLTRHIPLALASAALLLAFAVGPAVSTQTNFRFPECVTKCVQGSGGCETSSPRCMCKAANRNGFLETVMNCMFQFCHSELRDYDDTFLDIMEDDCKDLGIPIRKHDLKLAEEVASSLLSKLPQPTKAAPIPTKAPVTTTKTGTTSSTSSTPTGARGSQRTSSVDEPVQTPAAPAAPAPALPTSGVVPANSQTPNVVDDRPGPVPTDSSPFATFNSANSLSRIQWLVLPLLVVALYVR